MTARRLGRLALAVGALILAGNAPVAMAQQGAPANPPPGTGPRAQAFIAAFNKGDARAVAGFWMPDATYVDQAGNEHKGREKLQKLYEKVFATRKGAKLAIHVTAVKQLAADVGLMEGVTEVASPGSPPTAARFTAVLVKKDGEWYFQNLQDSLPRPPSNVEHYDDLEWLIGDWTGEEKGESGTASYHWAENQNFIVSTFTTTLDGLPVVGGTQWIAWDAVNKEVHSWTFYSGGGFGEASWSKDGNKWTLKTTAKSRDGKKLSATNILTKTDDDHLTVQITKLTVDGQSVPDPQPLKLKRVKPTAQ